MTSTTTDRRTTSLSASLAFKKPVKAATTAAITLHGEQTVDGVALVAGDRALVMYQTDARENGLYNVSTGNWLRCKDADGNDELVKGSQVFVTSGNENRLQAFSLSSADPVRVGTDNLTFVAAGQGIRTIDATLFNGLALVSVMHFIPREHWDSIYDRTIGDVDLSPYINNFLTAIGGGRKHGIIPYGKFPHAQNLYVKTASILSVLGTVLCIAGTPRNVHGFVCTPSDFVGGYSDIVIDGHGVGGYDGQRTTRTTGAAEGCGVYGAGITRMHVTGMRIVNCVADCIGVWGHSGWTGTRDVDGIEGLSRGGISTDIHIRNNICTGAGRNIIAYGGVRRLWIVGNVLSAVASGANPGAAIDGEPDDGDMPCDDVYIHDNVCSRCAYGILIQPDNVSRFARTHFITDNTLNDNDLYGIISNAGRNDVLIDRNQGTGNGTALIGPGNYDLSGVVAKAVAQIESLAADRMLVFTGSLDAELAVITAVARQLLDDASFPAMLTTLGALAKAGDTMTGALTLSGDPTNALHAATKQYVDNIAAGLDVKPSVIAASTANVNIASAPASLDGIAGVAGHRWLLKNQTAPAENGIWVFNGTGAALTRATDMDAWSEVPGALVLVEQGSTNADSGWVCTADQGGTLNTTAITWSQFFGTGLFQPKNANLDAIAALASLSTATLAFLGAADKAGQRTALELGTSALLDKTTALQYLAKTVDKVLTADQVWDAAIPQTLVDGATITPDLNAGINFEVTLGGNRALANPSSPKRGQSGVIKITQDGTGSRTLSYGANWKFPGGAVPTLTTTAGATDYLHYYVDTTSRIVGNLVKNVG